MQTKTTKKEFNFRKLYILFPKYWQNVPGTILFREPNNIVWGVKQYSFTCQTLLFRPRKSNLWRMKRKNTGFRSLEWVPCQQIGSFHKVRFRELRMSVRQDTVPGLFLHDSMPTQSVSICILQIAWKCHEIHPIVFWCEDGHCGGLRLTFCQITIQERSPIPM